MSDRRPPRRQVEPLGVSSLEQMTFHSLLSPGLADLADASMVDVQPDGEKATTQCEMEWAVREHGEA